MSIFVSYCPNPALFRTLLYRGRGSKRYRSANPAASSLRMAVGLLVVCVFGLWQASSLHAQSRKSKVPIVGKLTSSNSQQAYSGKVQSVDLKQRILNVNSLHGRESEIFPFKKNVRIESLNGNKMDLKKLTPGTTVLIYFDQRSGERTIRNIVVLNSGKAQAKGKPAPSS